MIVDEIGPLEVEGKGWAPYLQNLLKSKKGCLIWVVRPKLVNWAIDFFTLQAPLVVFAEDPTAIEKLQQFCEGSIV